MPTRSEHQERFRTILGTLGVRAALRYLNGVSPHRFTALFRFEGGILRNLYLIDKLDPTVERCPDQPVLESYCVYVRDTGRTFLTGDAARDERVRGHPKQATVRSYCGVPLLAPDRGLIGTICHFDFDPVPFAAEDVFLLEEVEPHLVQAVLAGEATPAA